MTDQLRPRVERVNAMDAAPQAYRAMTEFHRSAQEGLDPRLAELVRIRASQINGCTFCQQLHSRSALSAGETEQRLAALEQWPQSQLFTDRERAALQLAETMTLLSEAGVPDTVYEPAAAWFDPDELALLLWTIAAVNAWNRVAVAAGLSAHSS